MSLELLCVGDIGFKVAMLMRVMAANRDVLNSIFLPSEGIIWLVCHGRWQL